MILVAIVAELLEEYTVVVARVLEHVLQDAPLPFPRRVRFLILRNLPFASPPNGNKCWNATRTFCHQDQQV
ncbi:hypothetical protein SASPL_131449 [Salvia splendens]|uniref:Uncharacterized protein n=1 Tax=Salvia splendens TaxID=180675 RepID=A0A8X8ZKB3_SALSN|nr:hypothetical protein SASPL_131449 [Salvia splendens]